MTAAAASPAFLMFAIGLAGVVLGGLTAWAWLTSPKDRSPALPAHWALSPRLVFNIGERRLYRKLKDAFPAHVVMPKLPLVRLCQPEDLGQVHYWYSLLGSTHVTFAVCSPNGKALLALDLETRRSRSKRSIEIKEAVLAACEIKYFSMAEDGIPSVDALRLLMPQAAAASVPASAAAAADAMPVAVVLEEHGPTAQVGSDPVDRPDNWRDPSVFLDSFFAPDSRQGPAFDAESSQARPDPDLPARTVAEPASASERAAADVAHLELDGPDSALHWHRDGEDGGIVIDDNEAVPAEETSVGTTAGR